VGTENAIPIEQRWRAFYKLVLTPGIGSQVGIGRSATLWRNILSNQSGNYLADRMNEPAPIGTVRQVGDFNFSPITGGPFDLPAMWYTQNGQIPGVTGTTDPSYVIAMGNQAQVHFLSECFGPTTRRVWACLVDSVDMNMQAEFVELFPYAEFESAQCGSYVANFPDIGNRKVYSYLPPDRQKPFQPSVPLGTLDPGSFQWKQLFA